MKDLKDKIILVVGIFSIITTIEIIFKLLGKVKPQLIMTTAVIAIAAVIAVCCSDKKFRESIKEKTAWYVLSWLFWAMTIFHAGGAVVILLIEAVMFSVGKTLVFTCGDALKTWYQVLGHIVVIGAVYWGVHFVKYIDKKDAEEEIEEDVDEETEEGAGVCKITLNDPETFDEVTGRFYMQKIAYRTKDGVIILEGENYEKIKELLKDIAFSLEVETPKVEAKTDGCIKLTFATSEGTMNAFKKLSVLSGDVITADMQKREIVLKLL